MNRPPPYVPPEYHNRTMSEIPEPYQSDIRRWIEANTIHLERRVTAARNGMIFALTVVCVPLLVVIVFFAKRLF